MKGLKKVACGWLSFLLLPQIDVFRGRSEAFHQLHICKDVCTMGVLTLGIRPKEVAGWIARKPVTSSSFFFSF